MSQDEQKRLSELRVQLSSAHTEARLYRGMFWLLLALSAGATILHILQRS
ncbi:MAG TPA: hypothetical protein VFW05_15480 [Verrucomicrobiae bacterium]|nr:hypothetical protein [Verrucomicrobiae bacterium]